MTHRTQTRASKPPASPLKRLAGGILLSLLVTALTLGLVELGFRSLLFSDQAFMQPLREPGLYADQFDEVEYWKLRHHFSSEDLSPKHPHPQLGWTGKRYDANNHHQLDSELGERRPVLLFGDSFADCATPDIDCFDGILNIDPEFNQSALLLNFGTGGFGVGQIYLNLMRTLDRYKNPYVVVSFMLNDMDRSLLPFRIGQKPYFALEDEKLQVKGYPIEPSAEQYLEKHPLQVNSYLYRLLLHGKVLPQGLSRRMRGGVEKTREKIAVNRALLAAMILELERRGLEYSFLLFYPPYAIEGNWRSRSMEGFLERRAVDWFNSKDLVLADQASSGRTLQDYFRTDNHPTRLQNELIAGAIKAAYLRGGKQ